MSKAITALNGASFSSGIATVTEAPLQGMITLRGDLGAADLKKAVKGATGLSVPAQRAVEVKGETGVAWMSPDELLVLCPYAEVAAVLKKMQADLGKTHSLAVNVSDARAVFHVEGVHARDVIAKLCPVDTSGGRFEPGTIRRTRMAQVPAAFWMAADDRFQVICFRSQARYVFDLLSVVAQPGSEVFS